jgi:hypothetical protein
MSWGIFLEDKNITELYEMREKLADKLAQVRSELISVDREIQRRLGELMKLGELMRLEELMRLGELMREARKKERTIQEMIESEKERLENIKGIIINIEEPEGDGGENHER